MYGRSQFPRKDLDEVQVCYAWWDTLNNVPPLHMLMKTEVGFY